MSARILLVDDDFSVRETLSDILKANGYEVVECANASEAVDVVSKQPFDCAVIDLRLPDTSGEELVAKISARIPKSKIVIVTGYATEEILVKALKQAEYFFLLKPVEPDQLLKIIEKILSGL